MKTKKTLALLAAVLLLFGVGCKKESEKATGTSSSGSGDIDKYTQNLWIEDYDGYNFRILIRPGQVPDQYVEEGSADPIEDAVYKRNKTVEEMFNITITAFESTNANGDISALTSILAGDDAYDIIFAHTGYAFQYATNHAVHNINEIDTIHLDEPWWSKDMVEGCNINGNLYVLDGDISMHRMKSAMALYFNKRIFDELGLDYPYELVHYGEWTFDEFEELVKQGAKDLNGDGVMLPEDDQFGFCSREWQMPIALLATGGQRIYAKNEEGIPELTLNTAKTIDMYDAYFDMMDQDGNFLHLSDPPANYVGNMFTEGRAMFADAGIGQAQNYRSMEDDFGILPFPKFEYEDEYATVVNGYAHIFVIPLTVEDEYRTGAIIEGLCAIGSRDVVPVFYEQSLKTKFTRDNESEEMLDIIRDSIIYDIGYAVGGNFGYIGQKLSRSTTHDFSSMYAASESAELQRLKSFNEAYGGIEY